MAFPNEALILASASPARASLLRSAGLEFTVVPAGIDEAALKRRFLAAGRAAADCALALARAKACEVSRRFPEAMVVGADQILVCDGEWFDKPADRAAARRQLQRLRGRRHVLETAACAVCGSALLWHVGRAPQLTMREFPDSFLEDYLAAEKEEVLGAVGCYRLEERGVQLFERIDGDYFAILGLPLVELLGFLRSRGLCADD